MQLVSTCSLRWESCQYLVLCCHLDRVNKQYVLDLWEGLPRENVVSPSASLLMYGAANLALRNVFHSTRSWFDEVKGVPWRSLEGFRDGCDDFPLRRLVRRVTSRVFLTVMMLQSHWSGCKCRSYSLHDLSRLFLLCACHVWKVVLSFWIVTEFCPVSPSDVTTWSTLSSCTCLWCG